MKTITGESCNLDEEFLNNLYSVYPFNKFKYIISHLIAKNIITLEQYLDIRNSYLERNKYLYVFEITAPRTFGETWAPPAFDASNRACLGDGSRAILTAVNHVIRTHHPLRHSRN